uniref:Uncharacterized protein n=1 Tax=Tetranychus urticae TaxID=32264 RepID=T1L2D8_TETUR
MNNKMEKKRRNNINIQQESKIFSSTEGNIMDFEYKNDLIIKHNLWFEMSLGVQKHAYWVGHLIATVRNSMCPPSPLR